MPLFWLYKKTMTLGKPIIHGLMRRRIQKGKEDATRIAERFGKTNCPRPDGPLMWIHVASVGEGGNKEVIENYI
ncbi:MAG: 3-deoxy-D-manno-octulosonic acid transferase, partial [Pseudomonadota bacterium]